MNLLGRKEDTNAKPPAVRQAPPPNDQQPVRRRYADEALRSAQHLIDLENAVEALQHEVAEAKAEASAFRKMLDEYRQDIVALTSERDWHKQRHVDMETTLQNAAAMIVNCYDRGGRSLGGDKRTEQALAGMEKELSTTPPATEPVTDPKL